MAGKVGDKLREALAARLMEGRARPSPRVRDNVTYTTGRGHGTRHWTGELLAFSQDGKSAFVRVKGKVETVAAGLLRRAR